MLSTRRRLRALLVAGALSASVAVPAAAQTGDEVDATQQLEQTQAELDAAQTDLESILRRIDGVEAEVAAADARLASLQGDLASVEQELSEAEGAATAAADAVTAAQGALRDADRRFKVAEQAWADARSALEARVAATWIHGRAEANDVLLQGLLRSEDLHEVAVVQQASRRLLDHDQTLVVTAVDASIEASDARAEAELQQQVLEQQAEAAYGARNTAVELVAKQERLVAEAASTRAARASALASIEQDAAARAALVDRLTERVAELRLATLDQWLREIADIPFDGPAPAWAARLPSAGQPVAPAIEAASSRAGIDGRLLASLVWTESSFNHRAVSPAGAIGLTQLMPGTARGLGVDPYDPVENLTGGARYLRIQLERFGRIDLALAAYNAGPGRVVQAGYEVPDIVETQLYVIRVLDRWESLG